MLNFFNNILTVYISLISFKNIKNILFTFYNYFFKKNDIKYNFSNKLNKIKLKFNFQQNLSLKKNNYYNKFLKYNQFNFLYFIKKNKIKYYIHKFKNISNTFNLINKNKIYSFYLFYNILFYNGHKKIKKFIFYDTLLYSIIKKFYIYIFIKFCNYLFYLPIGNKIFKFFILRIINKLKKYYIYFFFKKIYNIINLNLQFISLLSFYFFTLLIFFPNIENNKIINLINYLLEELILYTIIYYEYFSKSVLYSPIIR